MSKKSRELSFEDVLEYIYYFLKNKLKFDDVQAITMIFSLILIPISIIFGFLYVQMEMFKISLYITLGIDLCVIVYSIVKYKYFKNKRVNFIKQFSDKTIEIKNLEDINKLNPIEFECFVKELFIQKGYKAWTTKASHDNGADVIAQKDDELVSIQVKHSIKPITANAISQADRGRRYYQADKAILVTNNELTLQAQAEARYFNIEYIDKHKLNLYLRKHESISFKKDNSIY